MCKPLFYKKKYSIGNSMQFAVPILHLSLTFIPPYLKKNSIYALYTQKDAGMACWRFYDAIWAVKYGENEWSVNECINDDLERLFTIQCVNKHSRCHLINEPYYINEIKPYPNFQRRIPSVTDTMLVRRM